MARTIVAPIRTALGNGLLFVGFLTGCGGQPPPQATPAVATGETSGKAVATNSVRDNKPPADWTANEVLQKLLQTYRQAQTYEDQGAVRLAFRQEGQPISEQWPVRLAFQRPNKLSLVAYQATVKSDGKDFKARIDDPETGNVDGQVVVRPAPPELKLADLASDALLYDILSSRLRRQPIQLELLLASGGLVSALGADVACRRLEDEKQDGWFCFRVEVPSAGGPLVFWVDQAAFLLRRLDYPAIALMPELAEDPAVSDVQLVAELHEAKIGGTLPPERFVLAIPAGAKRMKSFVIPLQPLPSTLFGKQPAEFYLTDLRGGRVSSKDLAGRIAVLVWYHENPACEATLQQISLARQRLKDEPDAVFYAITTDPTGSSNDALTRRLAGWNVDLPIVRDLEAFGDTVFKIAVEPTIVVLDKQGRVQIFQPGGNPQLADQLVTIWERLKRGDDLAAELLARNQRERQEYEQLVARGGPEPKEIIGPTEAVIFRRSEPKQLKIRPLWTCSELKAPGNILLVEAPNQPPRILVLEGWRTIAEVDSQGKIVARHALELPERAAVTYARTTTDTHGRRYFVASAPLGPQLFLFDEQWKLLLTYPPSDQAPLSLVDLAFADVGDPDGTPEIVAASVADVGLIALSLAGEIRWRNRTYANAVSVTVTPPDDIGTWAILVTSDSGGILRVNRFGKDEPPVTVGKWPMLRLIAGRFAGAKQAALLGLSNNAKGEPFAVGLTDKLKECWNYPLPVGVHQRPIEPFTSSHILPGRQGEWWLAGPDGSIHLISEDGELFDSFYYGAALTGLAATRFGEPPVLLVASDEGLAAWELQIPPKSSSRREF